jgi:hypothetical protein
VEKSHQGRLYYDDIYNHKATPLSIAFNKLYYAVDKGKIPSPDSYIVECKSIRLVDAIMWLEKEKIPVSQRLKEHGNISCAVFSPNEPTFANTPKEAAFTLYKSYLKGKITNRSAARNWLEDKKLPTTWGDDFVKALPETQKRPRKRPPKKSHAK